MTTLYLMRHSNATKDRIDTNDSLQVQNEKYDLSEEGKKQAEEKAQYFDNIDVVYASTYVRSIKTAQYIAERNDLELNIDSDLGERKFGFNSWSDKADDFERKQLLDENYKFGNGESQKDVRERMYNAVTRIVNANKGKRIVIVSHATAISFLLRKWCSIEIVDDKLLYKYKDKILLHGPFHDCELFKLDFDDDNNLVDINNIKEQ